MTVTAPRRRWRRPVLGRDGGPIRERDARAEIARRDAIFRRCLAVGDALAAVAVTVLCTGFHLAALLAAPLVLAAGTLVGAYHRDELLINKTTLDEAPQMFQLATLTSLLLVLAVGAENGALLWAAMIVALPLARRAARGVARSLATVERCLFVGSEQSCARLADKLASTGGRAVIVGRMDHHDDVADAAAALRRVIDELNVHRVVIEPNEATLDFVREAKGTGVRVSLLPRILEVVGSSIEPDDVQGMTLLGLRHFGLSRSSAFVKRTFDAIGAALALVVLSPLLAALALLIRLDSRGPAIYRQPRIGRDGREFTMLKLRTMVDGADALKPSLGALNEADGLFKIADDPRMTRVGQTLRRYSLDELPQLVNVLRGEMSLVGPRPLVRDDDARITGLDRRRLQLTPGMTGHWQILGSARVPLAEMIKLDYLYVAGWSLWVDVKILLRTVPYVLARKGM